MIPMTPEEFASRLRDIDNCGDIEASHSAADDLMCEVLSSLGYGEGVAIFQSMDKWYA